MIEIDRRFLRNYWTGPGTRCKSDSQSTAKTVPRSCGVPNVVSADWRESVLLVIVPTFLRLKFERASPCSLREVSWQPIFRLSGSDGMQCRLTSTLRNRTATDFEVVIKDFVEIKHVIEMGTAIIRRLFHQAGVDHVVNNIAKTT